MRLFENAFTPEVEKRIETALIDGPTAVITSSGALIDLMLNDDYILFKTLINDLVEFIQEHRYTIHICEELSKIMKECE